MIINNLEEYLAALATGATELRTSPHLAAAGGIEYLWALKEAAEKVTPHRLVVDCGDDAALALAALHTGFKFIGMDQGHPGINDIAAHYQADVIVRD